MDVVINVAVCPHGLTDFWVLPAPTLVAVYAISVAAVAAVPEGAVLAVFLVVSAHHLGAVVAVVALVGLVSADAAKAILLAHMLTDHLPAHYGATDMTCGRAALLLAVGAALEVAAFRPLLWPRLTTGLVAGHVVAGELL